MLSLHNSISNSRQRFCRIHFKAVFACVGWAGRWKLVPCMHDRSLSFWGPRQFLPPSNSPWISPHLSRLNCSCCNAGSGGGKTWSTNKAPHHTKYTPEEGKIKRKNLPRKLVSIQLWTETPVVISFLLSLEYGNWGDKERCEIDIPGVIPQSWPSKSLIDQN